VRRRNTTRPVVRRRFSVLGAEFGGGESLQLPRAPFTPRVKGAAPGIDSLPGCGVRCCRWQTAAADSGGEPPHSICLGIGRFGGYRLGRSESDSAEGRTSLLRGAVLQAADSGGKPPHSICLGIGRFGGYCLGRSESDSAEGRTSLLRGAVLQAADSGGKPPHSICLGIGWFGGYCLRRPEGDSLAGCGLFMACGGFGLLFAGDWGDRFDRPGLSGGLGRRAG
jgi:hypothetical protein